MLNYPVISTDLFYHAMVAARQNVGSAAKSRCGPAAPVRRAATAPMSRSSYFLCTSILKDKSETTQYTLAVLLCVY